MVHRDGLVLLFASILIFLFAYDLRIEMWEGIIMILAMVSYIIFLMIKKDAPVDEGETSGAKATWKDYLIFAISLFALIKSSDYVVSSAIWIAEYFKVSAWAIGATIVAAGTSLPELATSIIATVKKKFGISVGNVIGSDIVNTFGIVGISSVIAPINLEAKTQILGMADSLFSIVILIFTLCLTLIFMRTGWKISRREGVILFVLAVLRMFFEIYMGRTV